MKHAESSSVDANLAPAPPDLSLEYCLPLCIVPCLSNYSCFVLYVEVSY